MKLYVVRHALAMKRDEWGEDDHLRPLVKKGVKRCKRLFERMAAEGVEIDLLITSPAVRAAQTADILAAHVRVNRRESTSWLLPEAEAAPIIQALCQLAGRGLVSVALVGHEPVLSEVIRVLIGAPEAAIRLAKPSVAVLEMDRSGQAELHALAKDGEF